jgi:phosphatidylglycerophosphatase A
MRPDASFMVRHPAHWIALGFGSGLSPKAPGTMGTLWAWLSWWAFQDFFSVAEQAGIIVLSSLIGIWACKITAQNLEISDPGAIVWDEVVAFWCVLLLLSPADFKTQLAAFALFRFFDAAKPGPVAWADQLFKGFGWRGAFGIFFDDFVAAFCTLLCFAIWRAW